MTICCKSVLWLCVCVCVSRVCVAHVCVCVTCVCVSHVCVSHVCVSRVCVCHTCEFCGVCGGRVLISVSAHGVSPWETKQQDYNFSLKAFCPLTTCRLKLLINTVFGPTKKVPFGSEEQSTLTWLFSLSTPPCVLLTQTKHTAGR